MSKSDLREKGEEVGVPAKADDDYRDGKTTHAEFVDMVLSKMDLRLVVLGLKPGELHEMLKLGLRVKHNDLAARCSTNMGRLLALIACT